MAISSPTNARHDIHNGCQQTARQRHLDNRTKIKPATLSRAAKA